MSTSRLERLLRSAARTIEREADELRQSCCIPGTGAMWACTDCAGQICPSLKRYATHLATARKLRTEAQLLAENKGLT